MCLFVEGASESWMMVMVMEDHGDGDGGPSDGRVDVEALPKDGYI